MPLLIVIT